MKKLVTSGTGGIPIIARFLWVAFLISSALATKGQNCVMSCPPNDPPVQISLPASCTDVLTYDEIGVILSNCSGPITVDIMVNGMSIGDVIDSSMIGEVFMVVITDENSGQSCMTMITIVDKQAPILTCPADVTLTCSADLAEYTGLEPDDISDCSSTQVFIEDSVLFQGNCQGAIISQYLRKYIVVDAYQNADTCIQIISLTKAELDDVEFPADLSGLDALDCYPTPDTSPENTGFPGVDGDEIINGLFCNLSATFLDATVPLCSGSYKIIRTWTVTDWCDNNATATGVQIIEVIDHTPPVVEAPADFTMSTSESNCTADVEMPPANIMEDCSMNYSVRMSGSFGTIFSNGGLIPGLPVGVHRVIYIATSDCQLEGRDTTYVTVQDLTPPVPICHQALVVPVNNLGFGVIPAYIFNAASYDNCGQVYFKARRMTPPVGFSCFYPGNPNYLFDDQVQFCCQDIAQNPIMVVLRVYDTPPVPGPVSDTYLQGHFNDCMVVVEVQDKMPPQIICPSDLTISCQFPFTPENLDVFGTVALTEEARQQICLDDPGVPGNPGLQCLGLDGLATDNCQVSVETTADIDINNCGLGTISRTFTATDDGGLTATCVQTITVINYDPFSLGDITWPEDLTTYNICEIALLEPDELDPPYNEPILNDGPCDLVGFTHHDDVFDFSNNDQACFKILRTWKVIDWCQYNPPSSGLWTHLQVIKVMNNVSPEISALEDISTCSFDPNCGGLEVDLEAEAVDDCSSANSLTWRYYIDLDNDQTFDFTSPNIIGGSVAFTYDFPIGAHRVLFTVWDLCGNISTAEQAVTIESCKPPSAKCIHGLSTNLMAMDLDGDGQVDGGMVVLQAEMFDAGSDHPCGNHVTVAFSEDSLDVTRIFNCGDLGENEIELWAIDQNGLTDFCITTVDIQDNNHVCPPEPNQTGLISGVVNVPNAGKLAGAMIYLDGSNHAGIPTSQDGYFLFSAMPFGGSYTVRPVKDGDMRNGVTTLDLVLIQKHLLGLKTFSNPYQYIAADANNSKNVTAVDILQLRKLILGFYNELPNNSSWRFIDKAHLFPDPNNPWSTAWPETYKIIPFSSNMNDVDFNAVKIGDINLNASLQAGSSMILPRTSRKCGIEYDVTPLPEEGITRIDLYVTEASKYEAIQFSFDWDQRSYSLLDWSPGEAITSEDIRMPAQAGDVASVATYTVSGWPDERLPLLTMWVKSSAAQPYPIQLFLKPGPTPAVAYEIQSDDEVSVEFRENKSSSLFLQNRPNPFRDLTTIIMQSSQQEPATLRIYDLQGKLVHSRKLMLEAGENEFIVQKSDLRWPGIYAYEIESNTQYRTNRMIIVD